MSSIRAEDPTAELMKDDVAAEAGEYRLDGSMLAKDIVLTDRGCRAIRYTSSTASR